MSSYASLNDVDVLGDGLLRRPVELLQLDCPLLMLPSRPQLDKESTPSYVTRVRGCFSTTALLVCFLLDLRRKRRFVVVLPPLAFLFDKDIMMLVDSIV